MFAVLGMMPYAIMSCYHDVMLIGRFHLSTIYHMSCAFYRGASSAMLYVCKFNRVRLPILLVVSRTGKNKFSLSPFAPEDMAVPRQPAHSPHSELIVIIIIWCSLAGLSLSSSFPRRRHTISYRWRSLPRVRRRRVSRLRGSLSSGCCIRCLFR